MPIVTVLVAGRSLADAALRSAFVDIRITDETNTKDEKAAFVAQVFADLQRLLGPLHDESYVHVHDVRAAAYGYGGRTQAARYHHAGDDAAPRGRRGVRRWPAPRPTAAPRAG